MPRVVPDQRSKFENEEFFRKLSRECEIKYTGFRDRPHEEPQGRFQNACRDGRSEIAFVATGTNLSLQFFPASWQGEQRQTPTREYVDFEREGGKVYLKAPMILNGVCVIWKGWIDLQRLDGMGCLEFDEERAQLPCEKIFSLAAKLANSVCSLERKAVASLLFVILASRFL
ncbi:core-binding factor subunit beta isoform X5 [Alligator sinensis]|uniref:Core-binding factor subunit beta n=1 Tax=Alligator sinensis TaxID=38654 RepID=A0A3Q0G709_ALLSI|nr:core-binding factor subunit beta isoform X5 [Alligator sinensis]